MSNAIMQLMAAVSEPVKKVLDVKTLTMGANPRLPSRLEIQPLMDSIAVEGLREMITAWLTPKGVVEVLQGHRRLLALLRLEERSPERFKELFPKGIEVKLYEGIDERQATLLKLDHAGQVALTSKHELLMSVKQMMEQGFAEAEIANRLMPLIQKLNPLDAKKRAELKEFEDNIQKARSEGREVEAQVIEAARYKRIADMYHGRLTHMRNVARCPNIVEAVLFFKADGSLPKGFEKLKPEQIPESLGTKEVTALWKAHSEDIAEKTEEGTPKYNSVKTGPRFNSIWQEMIRTQKEAKASKTPRAKAMSANAMTEELSNGKYDSKGLVMLTKHHAGESVNLEALSAIDKAYSALDLLAEYDKPAYEDILELAEGVAQELQQSAMEKASTEADSSDKGTESKG